MGTGFSPVVILTRSVGIQFLCHTRACGYLKIPDTLVRSEMTNFLDSHVGLWSCENDSGHKKPTLNQ